MPVLRLAREATELQQAGDVKRSRHRLVGVPVGQVDDAGLDEVEAIEEPGRSTRGCAAGPGRVHHLGDLMRVLHSRKAGSKELIHSAGADTALGQTRGSGRRSDQSRRPDGDRRADCGRARNYLADAVNLPGQTTPKCCTRTTRTTSSR